MKSSNAILVLQDGTTFSGKSIGFQGESCGEVVFNTAMTGYQEILTDPSYCQQIVTLTYPHIGNTGTNVEDFESEKVWCSGLIIKDLPSTLSSWRNETNLSEFLISNKTVAISNIDTRKLVNIIREKGAQPGAIITGKNPNKDKGFDLVNSFPGLSGLDLAKEVTTSRNYSWKDGVWREDSRSTKYKVVSLDFGVKKNILRILHNRGCEIEVVPAKTTIEQILSHKPDGVFLSNGPGDPEPCDYAIETIKQVIQANIPVFGICLGHQLLALALGAKTSKMKFGHHGANHPVQDLQTQKVFITSQNHGFMVDEDSLDEDIEITHKSLFDGSIQGISHKTLPAFSFQGHPEASPGPHDIKGLFDKFIDLMENRVA